jgi:hypothetical protein
MLAKCLGTVTARLVCPIFAGCISCRRTTGLVATCKDMNEQEIAALFDRWNQSLQTR